LSLELWRVVRRDLGVAVHGDELRDSDIVPMWRDDRASRTQALFMAASERV
jgi:hypothetical protein